MDGSQNNYAKKPVPPPKKKSMQHIIPFIYKSRKFKLIYSNRKQTCGHLGTEEWGRVWRGRRRDFKRHEETCGGDGHIHFLDCGDGFTDLNVKIGTSLEVQWLRLSASTAGGTGSIPDRGTKIPQAAWRGQNNKK